MHLPRIIQIEPQPAARKAAAIEAAAILEKGGLILLPTDTVYGVAADARLPDAEQRIYAAKQRDHGKPIPLLAATLDSVESFGARLGPLERRLAGRFWPGPLTLVLAVGDKTEGFRVPDHSFAREVLREAGGILRVTSANLSGTPPALSAEAAVEALGSAVDLVLNDGPSPGGKPSTVARIHGNQIHILREGVLSLTELETA
jgi:L-threonylcarbamoyladenylate synthase